MMRLSIAAMLVVLVGTQMLCAEEPETIEGALDGRLRVIEPVGIDMPYPLVHRYAKPGEHLLLQVSYDPQGATPVAVNISGLPEELTQVAILGTGEQLHAGAQEKGTTGEGEPCCYVLLYVDGATQWYGNLTFKMSDGTSREVPYLFFVLSPEEIAAGVAESAHEWTYAARQVGNTVTVTVEGTHGSTGWTTTLEESPTNASPPEYNLEVVSPNGPAGAAMTPFSVAAQFTSEERVEFVRVHDSSGCHVIAVE